MKKGLTSEMIFTIGIIIAIAIAMIQFRTIIFGQQEVAQKSIVSSFSHDLQITIDRATNTPGNVSFFYYPAIKKYFVAADDNFVLIHDKATGENASFVRTNVFFAGNRTDDVAKICIKKIQKRPILDIQTFLPTIDKDTIYITGETCEVTETIQPITPTPQPEGSEFILLFIQINQDIPDFASKAESDKNIWAQLTPLKDCMDRVKAISIIDRFCSINLDQNVLCQASLTDAPDVNAQAAQIALNTLVKLEDCARSWGYEGKYTRVEGVFPGSYICRACQADQCVELHGYTFLFDSRLVSAEGAIDYTTSHEMGHTFGLCDEAYNIEQKPGCSSGWGVPGEDYCCPNKPDGPCIMCATESNSLGCQTGNSFAQDDYSHLVKELIEKNKYCG